MSMKTVIIENKFIIILNLILYSQHSMKPLSIVLLIQIKIKRFIRAAVNIDQDRS